MTIRNGPAPARPVLADRHWFKIANKTTSSAEVWLYAEIGAWGITATDLVSEISGLNVAELTVHLNSPGGDVFDGIAIMNALRDHPANVVVKVDALAASIASVIAQAGNKVIMGRNSTMMIHNASGFAMGEATDLRKMADLLDATTDNIASIYAERAGGEKKDWRTAMDAETWYTAEEAVEAGLADEVAPLPTEREAHQALARFDLSNFAHAPALPAPEFPLDSVLLPEPIRFDAAAFRAATADAMPKPIVFDADAFRTAVSMVSGDTPVPPPITPPTPPAQGFDSSMFAQAIREART